MCDKTIDKLIIKTPIGELLIGFCGKGLHQLTRMTHIIPDTKIRVEIKDNKNGSQNKYLNNSIEWLTDYFGSGQQSGVICPQFCPSVVSLSTFKGKVWSALMDGIKFGQTISYKNLAVMANNAAASRAVGTAMKNNPLILMIPCHRVIKTSGEIGKYSAGNSLKEWLIAFERQFNDN